MFTKKNLLSSFFKSGQNTPMLESIDFEEGITDAEVITNVERSDHQHSHQLFGGRDNAAQNTLNKTENVPYLFIGTVDELYRLSIDPPSTKTAILLTGELVLLSDTEVESLENYSRQTDRITRSIGDFTKRSIPFTLKVWLHKNVLETRQLLKRHRFCFAIDQYLRYGKTIKEGFRLVTGSSGNNETIIQIFTFERGNLTGIEEKVLPEARHPRFGADYIELLNTLLRTGIQITIADPLPNPESSQFSYVGNDIYRKPTLFPITDEKSKPSFLTVHGIAFSLIAAAFILYVGATVLPYNKYKFASNEFQVVAASIPKSDLAFGSDQLKTMEQRRFFLTEARPQQKTVRLLSEISYALSNESVIIKNIGLFPSKIKADDPDIAITIQTKRIQNESVLEQAKPLIDHLSARLGVTLRLAHNGYREQKLADGNFIQYDIEGNF
jgi:hypothetical protein